jgi:hypothetical protein
MYTFRQWHIPDRMMPAIRAYIEERKKPGYFLQMVITNNLKEALSAADEENLANIQAYVGYFYNEAPSPCWGSPEKMELWLNPKEDDDDESDRDT